MFQVVAAPARAIDTNNNLSLLPNGKKRQYIILNAGMRIRIRIRSDPVIFGPPDPDPVLFSTDPDPDRT